jgi:hypothetical protein
VTLCRITPQAVLRAGLITALVALVVAEAAARTPPAQSRAADPLAEPEALTRAQAIRTDVDARYRRLPGRKLAVTEATTTAILDSLLLLSDPFETPHVVSTSSGIYFAVCTARARCPYPPRSASWPAAALLPRRQALELALRTFLETPVSLVVVSLPTADPVWAIFERDDLVGTVDAPMVLAQLGPVRARTDTPLRELVDRLIQPRLFRPIPTLPPTGTLFAVALSGP